MMDVTVVIVNWNGGELLADCLRHLGSQTVLPKKIHIVDNASTDTSIDNLVSCVRTEIHKMPSNLGFAAANNFSLQLCDTEFIVFLNPDAFPAPDWLEQLKIAADRFPDAAAFGSRQLQHHDAAVIDGVGDSYHLSGLVWRTGYGSFDLEHDHQVREIFSPCAAAALFRTDVLKKLNGFDEDYFCYVEDVDLGFRLRLAGYKALYVPDAIVQHVGSATTGGKNSQFSVYHGHRNLVWTYIKNMPGMLFWAFLPLHMLLNIFTIAIFCCRGQGLTILRAKRDAFLGLPLAWRKRREIQRNRVATLHAIWSVLDKQIAPTRRRV